MTSGLSCAGLVGYKLCAAILNNCQDAQS